MFQLGELFTLIGVYLFLVGDDSTESLCSESACTFSGFETVRGLTRFSGLCSSLCGANRGRAGTEHLLLGLRQANL